MILWKNRVLVVSNIERYRQNFRSVCRQDTASRFLRSTQVHLTVIQQARIGNEATKHVVSSRL